MRRRYRLAARERRSHAERLHAAGLHAERAKVRAQGEKNGEGCLPDADPEGRDPEEGRQGNVSIDGLSPAGSELGGEFGGEFGGDPRDELEELTATLRALLSGEAPGSPPPRVADVASSSPRGRPSDVDTSRGDASKGDGPAMAFNMHADADGNVCSTPHSLWETPRNNSIRDPPALTPEPIPEETPLSVQAAMD